MSATTKISPFSINLKRMILSNTWTEVPRLGWGARGEHSVPLMIQYEKTPGTKDSYANRIKLKLSENLLMELGWKYKDSIKFMNHPEDQLCFMAIKAENSDGYKLQKTGSKGQVLKVAFQWRHDTVKIEVSTAMKSIEHMIHNGALIFRAE